MKKLSNAEREGRMAALLVDMLRATTRNTQQSKFKEFQALHAQRPPAFVRRLEQHKGLAK